MSTSVLSRNDAHQVILTTQGLNQPPGSTLAIIKQLSYVQIDTISVTERSHNHILHTRNSAFDQKELLELMDNKSIFEYWSHAAAYLPMSDFRYSLWRKEHYKNGNKHWFPRDPKVDQYVLDRIKNEGPLQSKDFEHTGNPKNEWYEWKPAKIALTNLFMDGSLMISNRKGFQKVFDLTERVLPNNINTTISTLSEYCNHLIIRSIESHGVVSLNEIGYLRKGIKSALKKEVENLLEEKIITSIQVEKSNLIYYTFSSYISKIQSETEKKLHILSPFDNIVIQRKRLKELFDFDYQIECYVPEKKRKYGYYTLPVLYGNEFVARFDAKADRKTNNFVVKHLWLEPHFKPTQEFYHKFSAKLKAFAQFCGCSRLKLDGVTPTALRKEFLPLI